MNKILNAKNIKKEDLKNSRDHLLYHSYREILDEPEDERVKIAYIRDYEYRWNPIGLHIEDYLGINLYKLYKDGEVGFKNLTLKQIYYLTLSQIFDLTRNSARIKGQWDDKLEEIFKGILKWSVEQWADYWEVSVEDAEKYLVYKLYYIDRLLDYKWSKEEWVQGFNLKALLKHEQK